MQVLGLAQVLGMHFDTIFEHWVCGDQVPGPEPPWEFVKRMFQVTRTTPKVYPSRGSHHHLSIVQLDD